MIAKKISLYTVSIYINTIFAAFQGILIAKILSQYDMGYFSQVKVILSYMMMMNTGIINGLLIVLPKNKVDEQNEFIDTSFWLSTFIYFIGGLISIIIYLMLKDIMFLYIFLIFPLCGIKEIPIYIMRGRGEFGRLSILYIVLSATSLIIVPLFAYFYSLKGALLGLLLNIIFTFVLGMFLGKIKLKMQFFTDKVVVLFKNGITIYLIELFRILKTSLEKFIFIFVVKKEIYAVYTVGAVMVSFFEIIPATFFQYLFPDFIKDTEKWSFKRMSEIISLITFIMTILLISGIYIFTIMIPKILPGYNDSLNVFYFLGFTSILNVWYYIIYNKLVSKGRAYFMYISQFAGFFVLILLVAYLYFVVKSDFTNMTTLIFIVLASKVFYILSLIYVFYRSEKNQFFTPSSYLIMILSILFIGIAVYLANNYSFIHIIPVIMAVYFILMIKKVMEWKNLLKY